MRAYSKFTDNIVVTPHVAWLTDGGTARVAGHPVENILAYLDETPRFVVNVDVLGARR